MNKLSCNIVEDLLPTYADGLVSSQTAFEIKEHLSECEKCSKIYSDMISGEDASKEKNTKEINYLKKVNSKTKKIIALIIAITFVLFSVPFCVYSYYGLPDSSYGVEYIGVNNNHVIAEFELFSSSNDIKVRTKENGGVVTIDIRSSLSLFSNKGEYYLDYLAKKDITKVQTTDGRILWQDDTEIKVKTNDIFNAKVKYIGNNSEVSNLLEVIDIHSRLQCENYSIHLITDKKPYGLEIYAINTEEKHTDRWHRDNAESLAYVILSCVENLDYVTFEYITDRGDSRKYTLSSSQASYNLNEDIKTCSKDVVSLQKLINKIEEKALINSTFYYDPLLEASSVEDVEKINDNPIERKYKQMLGDNNSSADEIEIYFKWAEAYEKQYKILCKALDNYADDDSIKKALEPLKDGYKNEAQMAELLTSAEEIVAGHGSGRGYTYTITWLNNIRNKVCQLAECAYLLGVEFEWVEDDRV